MNIAEHGNRGHGLTPGKRIRYYPMGNLDADRPMVQVLRAFTH